jgi:hypothetical protein
VSIKKRQHQPSCDFVDGFDCERRRNRRTRASPAWSCPGLPVRARGIARRWNRDGFGETAKRAKSRATSSLRHAGPRLEQAEWTHHRATHGFALAAPIGRGANLGLASFAVVASPRSFEATVESTLKVLTKSTAYKPRMRNHCCNLSRPAPCFLAINGWHDHRCASSDAPRFEYEIAYLSILELHRASLLHPSAGDDTVYSQEMIGCREMTELISRCG